jgi:Cu/Ag efflux pump CusA
MEIRSVCVAGGGVMGLGILRGFAAEEIMLPVQTLGELFVVRGDHDGRADLAGAVLQRRSVAVLTAALAVAALLLPAAVLGPRAGLELLHPLAVTALGGLVTSCVVLLFLLPPLRCSCCLCFSLFTCFLLALWNLAFDRCPGLYGPR